jgi:hypothetical protein
VRRVVQSTDWSESEFRATDWTYQGIAGQPSHAGTHHDASITASFR